MSKVQDTEVLSLISALEYQSESVVSRTILKENMGTVTLFAFDKGQELSEHSAPFDAIVQVLDGNLQISLAKKPFTVKTGELLIMPADVPHALLAVERSKMLLTMIKK